MSWYPTGRHFWHWRDWLIAIRLLGWRRWLLIVVLAFFFVFALPMLAGWSWPW